MNQKGFINILIIIIIIVLAGAGVYFVSTKQNTPPVSTPSPAPTPAPTSSVPPAGPIRMRGEITCLPKGGTSQQTMECAIGLKGQDGRYYGLKNLSQVDPDYTFSVSGLRVEVSGTFTPEEMKGPAGVRYDIAGTIDVISIKKLKEV